MLPAYCIGQSWSAKALVVGCGSTGSEIAKALLARGCDVIVVESKKKDEIGKFPEGAVFRHISELAAVISDRDLIARCRPASEVC
jgi:siroheme synthase (precorrin-2 oxidase/ferrochelatase)